jgi:hypothetical protein
MYNPINNLHLEYFSAQVVPHPGFAQHQQQVILLDIFTVISHSTGPSSGHSTALPS